MQLNSQRFTVTLIAKPQEPTLQPKLGKECVCPTAPQTDQRATEKNNEGITAPTQKAGFRVPKTVLWLIKH